MNNTLRTLAICGIVGAAAYLAGRQTAKADTQGRVFELRTYTCYPGKLDDLHKRFREHTMEIFKRHGMTNVLYTTPAQGEKSQNTLVYIISHDSLEAAKKNWADFRNDPEWQKVSKASEANGKIVEHVDSQYLSPTDYSPMK